MQNTRALAQRIVDSLIEAEGYQAQGNDNVIAKIVQAVQGRLAEYGGAAEQAGANTSDSEWASYVWEMCRHFARYYRLQGEAMINAARAAYQQLTQSEASGEQVGQARQSGYYESRKRRSIRK